MDNKAATVSGRPHLRLPSRRAKLHQSAFAVFITALWIVVLLAAPCAATAQTAPTDIRTAYNTRSFEAAKHVRRAMSALDGNRLKDVIVHLDAALKHDPELAFAYFQRGQVLVRLGKVDEALADWQRVINMTGSYGSIGLHAAINGGLTLANLGKVDEACRWFSRAILLDPQDEYGLQWKAYRNMAIALRSLKQEMSAAYAAFCAFEANPRHVERELVIQLLNNALDDDSEALRALWSVARDARIPARAAANALNPVEDHPLDVEEKIKQVLADPAGRFVMLVPNDAEHYYYVQTRPTLAMRKVTLGRPIGAGDLVIDGGVYLCVRSPAQIVEVEPARGDLKAVVDLPNNVNVTSLAMTPARDSAFVVIGSKLYRAWLTGGELEDLEVPADSVAVHPGQHRVYVSDQPQRDQRPNSDVVIIGGRPVIFNRFGGMERTQTSLMHFALSGDGFVFMEERLRAASNGRRIVVDPRGRFVALPGGGGWRPRDPAGHQSGYGVAVFDAGSTARIHGYFDAAAYPRAVAFNPVTDQLAICTDDELFLHHLSGASDVAKLELGDGKDEFSHTMRFSGDGRWLFVAHEKAGVSVFEIPLTEAEKRDGAAWSEKLEVVRDPGRPLEEATRPLATLKSFRPLDRRSAVVSGLKRAIKARRTAQLAEWSWYKRYAEGGPDPREMLSIVGEGRPPGPALYRIRQIAEKSPDSIPARFLTAGMLLRTGQAEEAERLFLSVVRDDAGQTDLTIESLEALADLHESRDESMAAMHCLMTGLQLDLAHPALLARTGEALQEAGMTAEAALLDETIADLYEGIDRPAGDQLPALGAAAPGKAMGAEDLYKHAAASVALVRDGQATGSAVCIADGGWFLTNAHVVGDADQVELVTFDHAGDTVRPRRAEKARVVRRWSDQDLALVQADAVANVVPPLQVADAPRLRAGQTVYAIGHPGLGRQILENTISQGIISAPRRKIEGLEVLQHTAPINAGSSGGPLLNKHGQVIGINVLRGEMENVGFAIPFHIIRDLLPAKP